MIQVEDIISETEVDVMLTASAFTGWKPDLVESRVVTFAVPEPRFVHGIPMSAPVAAAVLEFIGEVQGFNASSGFSDPMAVNTQADYRWLPSNYAYPAWQHTPQTALLETRQTFPRSWLKVARDESWDSAARTETWATLPTETVDPSIPFWTAYGAGEPRLLSNYTYWRRDRYVANPALGLDGSEGLNLVWTPTKTIAQMSIVMVVVPRAPLDDGYSLITAKPKTAGNRDGIEMILNADSTVSLVVEDQEASIIQLSGRARPNEPIVVALSVALDQSRDVLMAVIDEQVRTTRMQFSRQVSYSDLSWYINHALDSRMEMLEVDLYTNVASEDSMIRLGMLFNRVYGVTMR